MRWLCQGVPGQVWPLGNRFQPAGAPHPFFAIVPYQTVSSLNSHAFQLNTWYTYVPISEAQAYKIHSI